jgi:AraC family transcriptional regulator
LAIGSEIEDNRYPDRLLVECLSDSLAVRIIQRARQGDEFGKQELQQFGQNALQRIRDYIEANIAASSDLSLEELSGVAGLSRFHFIRAFKQVTGTTPHQYVMHCRVIRAKQLLERTKLPIAEVGRAAGFGSASHFARYFRNITGMSPFKFRQST